MRYGWLAALACGSALALPLGFEVDRGRILCRAQEGAFVIRAGSVQVNEAEFRLLGASHEASGVGIGRVGRTNYLVGDPSRWRTGIATYSRVEFRGVYPGIDVIWHGDNGRLEADWIVHPGANPGRIQLDSSTGARLDARGDLHFGNLVLRRPAASQGATTIPVHYEIRGRAVHLALSRYDPAQALVIDPVLSYAGFPGGSGFSAAATDASGNLYLAGATTLTDLLPEATALGDLEKFPSSSRSGGNTWSPLADTPAACQNTLAADPVTPSTLLAGGVSGICKSTDGGGTWRATNSTSAVYSIAFTPVNPKVVYAAINSGVLKSSDEGETWTPANSGFPSGPPGLILQYVAVDSINPQLVYAVSLSGPIFVSNDAGQSWAQSLAAAANQIRVSPFQTGVAYATTASGVIYKTSDGGRTWTSRGNASPPAINWIAIPPGDSGLLYGIDVVTQTFQKSADDGATWHTANTSVIMAGDLAAHPTDPNTLLAWTGAGIAKTVDGGSTWQTVFQVATRQVESLFFHPANPNLAFAGIHKADDILVVKYSPGAQNLIYATYLGGSSRDLLSALAVDAAGEVAIAGSTISADFPFTVAQTAPSSPYYVAKLNSAGNAIVYAIPTPASALAFDGSANLCFAGTNLTGPLTPTPGAFETHRSNSSVSGPFAGKLAPNGSVVYLTLLAGSRDDEAFGIAAAPDGSVIVVGETDSTDFPVTANALQAAAAGGFDSFIARIDPTGSSLIASTRLGGSSDDIAQSVTLDSSGNVYIVGGTESTDFPVSKNAYQSILRSAGCVLGGGFVPTLINPQDLFIAKLNASLTSQVYATYLGGGCRAVPGAIAVDPAGDAYVSATVTSPLSGQTQFPLLDPIENQPHCGSGAIAAGIDPTGSHLLFSTLLDTSNAPFVALDSSGTLYLGGTGCAASMVTTNGAPYISGRDGYLAVLTLPPTSAITLNQVLDAFTKLPATVSPGGLLLVTGQGFGAGEGVDFGLDPPSALETAVGGIQVFFDGIAAPIMSISAGVAYVITPYAIGESPFSAPASTTQIQVSFNGMMSNVITAPVSATAPSLLSLNGSGTGQANARSLADGSLNSPSNPAAAGSILTFYATGLGATFQDVPDGGLAGTSNLLPMPVTQVQLSIGNQPAQILNVSGMPGFVNGIFQIQAMVPIGIASGPQVPVSIGNSNPAAPPLTIAIR